MFVLRTHRTIDLSPAAPFNFDATMYKPDHFPTADNAWRSGVRWQTMRWQGKCLGLKFKNSGTTDHPSVALTVWSAEELDEVYMTHLVDELEYRFDFQRDLTEFGQRFHNDPQLAPIVNKWRGMRPLNHSSLYEYLIVAIVLQNATVRRSVQMMQALFEKLGASLSYDGRELYVFWQPEVISRVEEQELRELKVGYRAKSIRRVSAAFAVQEIDEFALRRATKEEQRSALVALYGIGPASVGYILSDVFHHFDELNHISPWEQKIYSRLFFDCDIDDPVPVSTLLRTLDKRYGEYKMLAVHYIWEDLFWLKKQGRVEWLEKLIRL